MDLKQYIDDVPDFPEEGIIFWDISPLLAHKFSEVIDSLSSLWTAEELQDIDAFAGIDARGFIFASALAVKHNKNMVIVRKAGKLPPPAIEADYDLEYGSATLQMKSGTGKIILIDDVIATGGTLNAAADLCRDAGYTVTDIGALINLSFLNDFEWSGIRPKTVLNYYE